MRELLLLLAMVVSVNVQAAECKLCDKLDQYTREYKAHVDDETGDATIDIMEKVRDHVRDVKFSEDKELQKKEMRALLDAVVVVLPDDFDLDTIAHLIPIKKKNSALFEETMSALDKDAREKINSGMKEWAGRYNAPAKNKTP